MRLLCAVIVSLLFACESQPSHLSEPNSPGAAPAAERTQAPKAAPQAPTKSAEQPSAAAGANSAGGLRWQAPAPLIARAPKSSMRAAEYGLEGEPTAELSVFYFGPDQGGSIDANLTRWLGQFSQPDGSSTQDKSKREELNIKGMAVTTIEVTGTYSGGMGMPGMAAPSSMPHAMLLGAIASGPKGPVFFKLVGPKSAVEGARGAFRSMLDSLTIQAN